MSTRIVIGIIVLAILGFMVAREVRRTRWTLLETVIAVLVLGHVIAFFCVIGLRYQPYWDDVASIIGFGIGVTMAMAFGSFWVFRDLAVIEEKRTVVRLFYLFAGLLLLPSFVAFPFNLVLGWIFWLPLAELHGIANCRRNAPVQLPKPSQPYYFIVTRPPAEPFSK